MKQYIKLITDILNDGGKIIDCENFLSDFVMHESVEQEDLFECELYFDRKLPEDYKYFLNIYNGGKLFNYNDLGGFRFFSAKELICENEIQKNSFGNDWDNNIILFSDFICGDAEYLGFRPKEDEKYDIIDLTLYEPPSEWRVIDNSFDNFVEKLIKEKGKVYWL